MEEKTQNKQKNLKRGFTLLELLVVVLIIGILAAIALPQYRRAVEKSKASQALSILESIYQSFQAYYLDKGAYPTKFSDLDISLPNMTGHVKQYIDDLDTISDKDWSLQIRAQGTTAIDVMMTRISGQYKGASFLLAPRLTSTKWMHNKISCYESKNNTNFTVKKPGAYCEKILNGTLIEEADWGRYYSL